MDFYTRELGGEVVTETLRIGPNPTSNDPSDTSFAGQGQPVLEIKLAKDEDLNHCCDQYKKLLDHNAQFGECTPKTVRDWRWHVGEDFRRRVDDSARWWLAWEGNKPVGLLIVEKPTTVKMLYVDQDVRGKGLGHRFINKAKQTRDEWDQNGNLWVSLESRNIEAKNFYTKVGFEPYTYRVRLFSPIATQKLSSSD